MPPTKAAERRGILAPSQATVHHCREPWQQELEAAGHTAPQPGSRDECWWLAFSLIQFRTSAHVTVAPEF